MNVRIASVAAILACSLALPVLAQQRRGGGATGISPTRLTPGLQTKLNITADQKTKLEAISMKAREEGRALGQDASREQRAELNRKFETEALGVLTADQKKTYEGWKAELDPLQGLGRTHIALLSVTGLSADQKTQLKELSTAMQAKRREATQGGGGGREAFQALETETQAGIKKILTADQAKQFDTEAATIPSGRRPQ